ncbi:hypothetical protein [Fructilactobacillus fructivorans]|nr:hypothetical protein [Fructilactobacillus fructivorans]
MALRIITMYSYSTKFPHLAIKTQPDRDDCEVKTCHTNDLKPMNVWLHLF